MENLFLFPIRNLWLAADECRRFRSESPWRSCHSKAASSISVWWLWTSLCKLAKINGRPRTLNQDGVPVAWCCPACKQRRVFFSLQPAGFIQISAGLHAVRARKRVPARLLKCSRILHCLTDTLRSVQTVIPKEKYKTKYWQKKKQPHKAQVHIWAVPIWYWYWISDMTVVPTLTLQVAILLLLTNILCLSNIT